MGVKMPGRKEPLRMGTMFIAHADDLLPLPEGRDDSRSLVRCIGMDHERRHITYEVLTPSDPGYAEAESAAKMEQEKLAKEYGVSAEDLVPERGKIKVFEPR